MPEKILVVAAHPDDEVLGCGGTIVRHVKEGDEVHILIAAEGATSRYQDLSLSSGELASLELAVHRSASALGAKQSHHLKLPDNRLDSLNLLELVKLVEEKIATLRPSIVYVHHIGDVNIDHSLLHKAVVTACRPTPGHCVKKLLSYETCSSTEWQPPGSAAPFQPNYFVDISHYWLKKLKALHAYDQEMRPWPHPRSYEAVEYLSKIRGAQVGVNQAEAFCLLRQVV